MTNSIIQMDRIYAIRLMQLLLKPFTDQKAYSLGLIDKDGTLVKKPKGNNEIEAFTPLHQLAFRLKTLLEKIPGSNQRLKQLAVAMNLLRTQSIPSMYQENFELDIEGLFESQLKFIMENDLVLIEEETMIEDLLDVIEEESVTAGIDASTPVIKPKKKAEEDESIQTKVS
jgi:hypothetical protein